MKKQLLIIAVLTFGLSFSQTHRYIYELSIKRDNQINKMNMVLDIDKDYTRFYDYDFLRNDSISKKTGENRQNTTQSDQLILRKTNTSENKAFHDSMFDYFVIDSKDEMTWKIENETKKSAEYSLQKATADFGGRKWTAWFCNAVPFQEGPYKFRGLPGLIFELQDDQGTYIYTLLKSINLPETFATNNFLETHYGKQPVKVTLKQFHKVKMDYYNDPVADMKNALKNGGTVVIRGEKITSQEQLDQKRKFLQEIIRKNYNPIEPDKAIPYPEN